ncbi:protein YIPF3-like [Aethina tumida]|uniref:protein YIPF3-like n=1 Tax=Aethina tumida TaxID=116153 RepID=UPI002147BF4B|nr:protein YIPF3-like [Aethina tumida]
MSSSTVIFIGSPERNLKNSAHKNIKNLFFVSPNDVASRIFGSFVPPVSKKYQKVYIDLLGPILGFLILTAFLNYGFSYKVVQISYSPTESMCAFGFLMPLLCFLLSKIGGSNVTPFEIVSLVGYSLYGHIFTLLASYICFQERSNFFFFVCLIFFGGLSTLRLALVFLFTIPIPAARLLICTVISLANILYLIFLHFAYMHRTFMYKDESL